MIHAYILVNVSYLQAMAHNIRPASSFFVSQTQKPFTPTVFSRISRHFYASVYRRIGYRAKHHF